MSPASSRALHPVVVSTGPGRGRPRQNPRTGGLMRSGSLNFLALRGSRLSPFGAVISLTRHPVGVRSARYTSTIPSHGALLRSRRSPS